MSAARTILLRNGRILTMAEGLQTSDQVLVADGKIAAVGSKAVEERLHYSKRDIDIVDLQGKTVVPGFIESHVHPTMFGLNRTNVDCRPPGIVSIAGMIDALKGRVDSKSEVKWIIGHGYDDTGVAEMRHPNRGDLDNVSVTQPVVVTHISGHFMAVNSKALELAGITSDTKDPIDGKVCRDSAGQPTGLLWEIGAVRLMSAVMPKPSADDLVRATEDALLFAASRGITTVHDMAVGLTGGHDAVWTGIEAYRNLESSGKLPVRVRGFLRGDAEFMDAIPVEMTPVGGAVYGKEALFKVVGVKYWADGSIQGLSAALNAPYSCCETNTGDLNYSLDTLAEMISKADKAGFQVAVHTNGDRAIDVTLDAFARIRKGEPTKGGWKRHRLEHAQVVSHEQLRRMVELSVNASFFINHVYYWGDRHRDRFLGVDRAMYMDPLRTAKELGVVYGVHSDCPVTLMDPLFSLWVACNRKTANGLELGKNECVSPGEGMRALGSGAAMLTGDEQEIGALKEGSLADLVVLDANPLEVPPAELKDIAIDGVMMNGNWTYSRQGRERG